MRNYCLACRKHNNNVSSRNISMTSTVIRNKPNIVFKSRFLKQGF